jgi:hypothetical protein
VTVYTFSEARQKFASMLEQARREGAVRVKRRDGQVFVIQPDRPRRSPLDVPGIDTEIATEEIVGIVREMRQRVGGQLTRRRSGPAGKRAAKSKRK